MPWASVIIRHALAVMPGNDDSFTLGSETLREKLSFDVMIQLEDIPAAGGASHAESKDGARSTDRAPAEVPALPQETIGVRRVTVTVRAMQQPAKNSETIPARRVVIVYAALGLCVPRTGWNKQQC